jgi:hypothetical protein
MKTNAIWYGIAVAILSMLCLVQIRPNTIRQNDAAALGKLRLLIEAQSEYASKNPGKGFSCNLADFMRRDEYSGYRFLLECRGGDGLKASGYELVVQPLKRGTTGIRTFCATELNQIWYDDTGSARECLTRRRAIFQ